MALGYSAFNTPAGNVAPTLNGRNFNATFSNTATFTCASTETCAAGEYRQYVMGSFSANGSPVAHILCGGTLLSATAYLQDGCAPPTCTAYGYRACTGVWNNQFTPTQATGANYSMSDSPGFVGVQPLVNYGINLSFKGSLVNTATNTTLVTQSWTVIGSSIPTAATTTVATPVGLRASDKVVSVDLTHNLESGAAEAHVVIRRRATDAPLSAEALRALLKDADGGVVPTLGAPAVHEVGGRFGSTASLVYTLADNALTPEFAELTAPVAEGRLGLASPHVTVMSVKLR